MASAPVYFEANRGQVDARVDYFARGLDHELYLTSGTAAVMLRNAPRDNAAAGNAAVLRIATPGSRLSPAVSGEQLRAGKSHYLKGDRPEDWTVNVPNYGRVRYEGVYPDIDLVYYGNGRKLEYDFVVAPGADPGVIRLAFDGADAVTIENDGTLRLAVGGTNIVQHAPVIYQEHGGQRQPVSGSYIYSEDGHIGFQLAAYDTTLPLVIDPVLDYSAYFGGSASVDIGAASSVLHGAGDDRAFGVAVDSSGNIYVAGRTLSGNFPTVIGSLDTRCGNNASVDCNSNNSVAITAVTLPNSTVTILVSDPDLNTNATTLQTVTVTVVNDTTAESESVILTETGVNTGAFAGTLPVTLATIAGANNDGVLVVLGGGSISAKYNDVQTVSGGAATISAIAIVPNFTVMVGPVAAAGDTETVIVKDDPLNTDATRIDSGFVQLVNRATGESESVPVIESAIDSGVFTGTVSTTFGTTAGTDNDGTLNAQSGDDLAASYPAPLTVTINEASLGLTDPLDILNNNTAAVETIIVPVANDRTGETENVTLTETDINSGLFSGGVPTFLASTAGTSGSGVMRVQTGDTFTATGSLTVVATSRAITASKITSTGTVNSITTSNTAIRVGGDTVNIASIGFPGDNVTVTVNDTDLNVNASGSESTTVTVSNNRTGESETLALSETGVNTGTFTGVLPTASSTGAGASNDGTLNVSDGDTIIASYADTRASNGVAAIVTASGTVGGFNNSTLRDALLKSDAFVTRFDATGQMVYSTYLGGGSFDSIADIAVDDSGNAYVTGTTQSRDFPATGGAYNGTACTDADNNSICDDGERIFVAKLDSGGTALTYSTFIGYGNVHAIAVNSAGQTYIAGGTTSPTFPTLGPIQAQHGGAGDAFVTKLNAAGTALVYSTYLGGSGPDAAFDIALDSTGAEAYITGQTASSGFPVTGGAYDTACGFSGTCNNSTNTIYTFDAFVSRLNAAGNALLFSTFLGGSNADYGHGIAVDTSGNAYVTGTTTSVDFPATAGTIDGSCDSDGSGKCDGGSDIFVTKLASNGAAPLAYSTYIGGGSNDSAEGMAVDAAGSAYVVGYTFSSDFPMVNDINLVKSRHCVTNATTPNLQCVPDAIALKVDAAGSALDYSTYVGAQGSDYGMAIALDNSGATPAAVIAGYTSSSDWPLTATAPQTSHGDLGPDGKATGFDAFVARLSGDAGNLAVTVTESADPVPALTNLTYTVAVSNIGAIVAEHVVLTHELATPLSDGVVKKNLSTMKYVSAAPGQGTCSRKSRIVTCNLGTIAVGASATTVITVIPESVGSFRTVNTVESYMSDGDRTDNTGNQDTTVSPASFLSTLGISATTSSGSFEWFTLLALMISLSPGLPRRRRL